MPSPSPPEECNVPCIPVPTEEVDSSATTNGVTLDRDICQYGDLEETYGKDEEHESNTIKDVVTSKKNCKDAEIESLKQENESLKLENASLQHKNKSLEQNCEILQKYNDRLTNRCKDDRAIQQHNRLLMQRGQIMAYMRDEGFTAALLQALKHDKDRAFFKKQPVYKLVDAVQSDETMLDWDKCPFKVDDISKIYQGFRQISNERLDIAHPTKDFEDADDFSMVFDHTVEYICTNADVSDKGKQQLIGYKPLVKKSSDDENQWRERTPVRDTTPMGSTSKSSTGGKRKRSGDDDGSLVNLALSSPRSPRHNRHRRRST